MKVLLVSEPGIDGVFRHVDGLTRYLMAHGVTVALAYSSRRSGNQLQSLLGEMKANGDVTLDLAVGNSPGPPDLAAILKLRRLARDFQPDVIHGHSSKGGALGRGLHFLGIKAHYFYTPHAYYGMNGKKNAKFFLFNTIEKFLASTGNTINMSQGESVFAFANLKLKPGAQFIIPNGVDYSRFAPASNAEKIDIRKEFSIPEEAFVFGTVGRTSSQKDPMTTYRALVIAMKDEPRLFFAHLGRGELDEEIEAFIAANGLSERVRRIPFLSNPIPFYQALDGFVLSSLYEGMSYAILETMSVNLPLVLASSPGNSDFGGFGLSHLYWAKPGNYEELAASLLQCLHAVESGSKEINHRQLVRERFSEDICYGATLAAYAQRVSP